jgi:hypothetical protein
VGQPDEYSTNACRDTRKAREWGPLRRYFLLRVARSEIEEERIIVTENQSPEPKTSLVIRVPVSVDGYVSVYFTSKDARLMRESEWWHLKQVVELASAVSEKSEERARAAAAGG